MRVFVDDILHIRFVSSLSRNLQWEKRRTVQSLEMAVMLFTLALQMRDSHQAV